MRMIFINPATAARATSDQLDPKLPLHQALGVVVFDLGANQAGIRFSREPQAQGTCCITKCFDAHVGTLHVCMEVI